MAGTLLCPRPPPCSRLCRTGDTWVSEVSAVSLYRELRGTRYWAPPFPHAGLSLIPLLFCKVWPAFFSKSFLQPKTKPFLLAYVFLPAPFAKIVYICERLDLSLDLIFPFTSPCWWTIMSGDKFRRPHNGGALVPNGLFKLRTTSYSQRSIFLVLSCFWKWIILSAQLITPIPSLLPIKVQKV